MKFFLIRLKVNRILREDCFLGLKSYKLLVLFAFFLHLVGISVCSEINIEPDPYNLTVEEQLIFTNKITISKDKSLIWSLRNFNPLNEKHFVVLIPSYNNSKWYKKNLDSIFMQKYSNYSVIYIDDASTDSTGDLVKQYVIEKNQEQRVTIVKNKVNCGVMANIYNAIHDLCKDADIIVSCDGDDWWCNELVLETLNKIYQKYNVWMTHGDRILLPGFALSNFRPYTPEIIKKNKFRDVSWNSTGLRTYYAWLFKLINRDDLMFDGDFFKTSHDYAIMYPMFEMSAERHLFIYDVFYVYNHLGIFHDGTLIGEKQKFFNNYIKSKRRYLRLDKAPCGLEVDKF